MRGRKDKAELERDRGIANALPAGQPRNFGMGFFSILLTARVLVQLLIPNGVLFEQVMFVSTLAVSWGYNTYLSSINSGFIQTTILRKISPPNETNIQSFELRMSTVACFAFQRDSNDPLPDQSSIVWDAQVLPSTTEVRMRPETPNFEGCASATHQILDTW